MVRSASVRRMLRFVLPHGGPQAAKSRMASDGVMFVGLHQVLGAADDGFEDKLVGRRARRHEDGVHQRAQPAQIHLAEFRRAEEEVKEPV